MSETFKLVVLIRADDGQASYVQIGQATEEDGVGGRYLNFLFWEDQGDNELLVIAEEETPDLSEFNSSRADNSE